MTDARKTAFFLLEQVLGEGKYANLTLKDGLPKNMSRQDKALVTVLIYGTLDKLIYIDYVLSLYAKGRIQPKIRNILRLGVYQILFLDKVPDSAAVNESLELAEHIGKGMLKGYLNGVLRTVAREKDRIPFPEDKVENLSTRYSWPAFLVRELLKEKGEEMAQAILRGQDEHWTTLRVNTNRISIPAFKAFLQAQEVQDGLWFDDCVRITGEFTGQEELYAQGLCTPQGEASMAAVRALGARKGKVLDCCAAPGGKTIYIAQLLQEGKITALDKYEHRVRLIRQNARRCGFERIIDAREGDAKNPEGLGTYDFVLVDVPCSGLGVTDSKPEIKLTVTPEGLSALEAEQAAILGQAAGCVRHGGVLIYSTCTIRNAENREQVNRFLVEHPEFSLESMEGLLGSRFEQAHDVTAGFVQLYRHKDGTDGFFFARLRKK